MIFIFDTSSFLSLVRYYMPFDKTRALYQFFQNKIASGEIIVIDKVLQECEYNSGGIVVSVLDFLMDPKFQKANQLPYRTKDILAPQPAKFLRMVENQFANLSLIRQMDLSDTEFEIRKNEYLKGADCKQIILGLNLIRDGKEVIIVTEETERGNDNKEFKKIPAICKMLDIESITLPDLLRRYEIEIGYHVIEEHLAVVKPLKPVKDAPEKLICEECKHYNKRMNCCAAFPRKIPHIVRETNIHDKPIDGQRNSLVFTPKVNISSSSPTLF